MTLVIEGPAPAACHELVALDGAASDRCVAVLNAAGGRYLGFAPGRWLLVGWNLAEVEALEQQAAGLAAAFEVTGKYHTLVVRGTSAARALHRAVDADAVLDGRPCAAVTLFDCPAVVTRVAEGFEIWVRASYAAHLVAGLRG